MPEQPSSFFVNGNTYINLATVLIVITATLWIKNGQTDSAQIAKDVATSLVNYKEVQQMKTDLVLERIGVVQKSVDIFTTDRWTATDQKTFMLQLKQLNPNIIVPTSSRP